MCLFLTNLEIPIATTALVAITEDFGGFSKASWVISSYLLGYVGKPSMSYSLDCSSSNPMRSFRTPCHIIEIERHIWS